MRPAGSLLAAAVAGALCGCAGQRTGTPDDAPTLRTLAGREVKVAPDAGVRGSEEQAIAAYRKFLEIAPKAPQRPEAMRRLGDLEMASADNRSATASANAAPDYRAAIARYQDYLVAYPKDPGNDRVLYQLSRAREQGGQLEMALASLDRLLAEFPKTAYRDEAQFRRGELLFTLRQYPQAEQAYAAVLGGAVDNPYQDRALYMQGWSRFKQGRLDDALHPFFGVLDLKLAAIDGEGDGDALPGLSRADRELVEDTFRVMSVSLANLQGAASIPPYITTPARRDYEFRVYQQLGELYIKQDRVKDAADTFVAFARRAPLHAQSPKMQARVIEIYQRNGFAMLALEAKKDYVTRYAVDGEFARANPGAWARSEPLLKTHLAALARHYHAAAQAGKAGADYAEAVRWYRVFLRSFPSDPEAAQSQFLLAELLFEDRRFDEAAVEYAHAAYDVPAHDRSADAGYAALLSLAEREKQAAADQLPARQRDGVAGALRFAAAFPADPRTGPVLAHAAEVLYALHDNAEASPVATQVLALTPPAAPAQRRIAWIVIAHAAFEGGVFDRAERAYGEVIALTPAADTGRAELVERLAASVYKQGEQARADGQARAAVAHFERVANVAPESAVRATAQYDAAAALIGLADWDGASRTLEDFRQRYPKHALQAEVGGKLAVTYLEKQQWAPAAAELERIAATSTDPQAARAALWQAAELYEKAQARPAAARAYAQYLAQNPQPLEPAIEARHRLARIAKAEGNGARELALMQEILAADQSGGAARTARTRTLGATAALALAGPALETYRKVELVEPLAKQLKLKKARLEDVLRAYAVASEYGVAEVTTASTFHVAALYQDFGRALMASERPKKLSKSEREQYDVMLEEQAFPFEEKAIELHELNARRASAGLYDEWVQASFAALRELRPVRYAKSERSEGVIDAIR